MVSKRQLLTGNRIFMGAITIHCILTVCFFFSWDASPVALGRLLRRKLNILDSFARLYRTIEYTAGYLNTRNSTGNVLRLLKEETVFCQGKFNGCFNLFAVLFNVSVNPDMGHGRRGGDDIADVLNQTEESEYFKLDSGYFSMNCLKDGDYQFIKNSHLNEWVTKLNWRPVQPKIQTRVENWTIAVTRYEYANFYHTMTDFYNVFLVLRILQIDLKELSILWIDGHPWGSLDPSWRKLFGNVIRAGELTKNTVFSKMVWGIMGYNSPMERHDLMRLPLLEDFRRFFLSRHDVIDTHEQNCRNLRVLFIWRRDYLAHPRNPSGKVTRKIKNEEELISSVRKILPEHSVRGVQIDRLSMDKQLELIVNTDILIGVHGAGLSHTLFLPQTSGVIELFPVGASINRHFKAMAYWRNLKYFAWKNSDFDMEDADSNLVVDTDDVKELVDDMFHSLCTDSDNVPQINRQSYLMRSAK